MSAALALVEDAPPAELVERINEQHRLAVGSVTTMLEHAINCGNLLREVQIRLHHGEWGKWLEENFEASDRTAQQYMQVAHHYNENPQAIAETNSHEATISSVVKSIARAADGPRVSLPADDPDPDPDELPSDPPAPAEARYTLTLPQLTELARKRWHRAPDEDAVRSWLEENDLS